jgi:hypothetical protein
MIPRSIRRAGTIVLPTLFVVLALFVLLLTIWNAAAAVHAKLDAQNAADAAAHVGGVQLARGMNQLTARNHALGDANAVVVLAHTPGGPELEAAVDGRGSRFDLATGVQEELDAAYQAAALAGTPVDAELARKVAVRSGMRAWRSATRRGTVRRGRLRESAAGPRPRRSDIPSGSSRRPSGIHSGARLQRQPPRAEPRRSAPLAARVAAGRRLGHAELGSGRSHAGTRPRHAAPSGTAATGGEAELAGDARPDRRPRAGRAVRPGLARQNPLIARSDP